MRLPQKCQRDDQNGPCNAQDESDREEDNEKVAEEDQSTGQYPIEGNARAGGQGHQFIARPVDQRAERYEVKAIRTQAFDDPRERGECFGAIATGVVHDDDVPLPAAGLVDHG